MTNDDPSLRRAFSQRRNFPFPRVIHEDRRHRLAIGNFAHGGQIRRVRRGPAEWLHRFVPGDVLAREVAEEDNLALTHSTKTTGKPDSKPPGAPPEGEKKS